MDFTGERPNKYHEVFGSRLRYKSILPYCIDKKILDFGCGIGLGSYFLSYYAKSVIGYDVCKDAITEARIEFNRPNITFTSELSDAVYENVELVCMVESVEHIQKPTFLELLKKIGSYSCSVVITTPNGNRFPYHPISFEEYRGFHVWHYTYVELVELFKKFFNFVNVSGDIFDGGFTSYEVYASNKIGWDDQWLHVAKK